MSDSQPLKVEERSRFMGRIQSCQARLRFGSMAAVTLAAKAVAAAGIWKIRSGEGQDIHVDVRKALRRFASILRA